MSTVIEPRSPLDWGLRLIDPETGEVYVEAVDWELILACQRAIDPIIRYRTIREGRRKA